jgi:predicted PurR-regulated permease PerM
MFCFRIISVFNWWLSAFLPFSFCYQVLLLIRWVSDVLCLQFCAISLIFILTLSFVMFFICHIVWKFLNISQNLPDTVPKDHETKHYGTAISWHPTVSLPVPSAQSFHHWDLHPSYPGNGPSIFMILRGMNSMYYYFWAQIKEGTAVILYSEFF